MKYFLNNTSHTSSVGLPKVHSTTRQNNTHTSKVIRLWSTTPCMDDVSNAFSSSVLTGIAAASAVKQFVMMMHVVVTVTCSGVVCLLVSVVINWSLLVSVSNS